MSDTATKGSRFKPALTLGALGVVFGDIGTSPLYAISEVFGRADRGGVQPTEQNVLGVVSLIIWTLVVIVAVKYLLFVMRADNNGEGGILALVTLVIRQTSGRTKAVLVFLGLAGAALLYADGLLTPAISVLSAVEGTKVIDESMTRFVVLISVAILLGLFAVQRFGTARIGKYFGPVMVVWFVVIGALGAIKLLQTPDVLAAINPVYGARFILDNRMEGFFALGAVFFCITGAEALYADMGHYGLRPIRHGWNGLVFPSLALSYIGQGASIIDNPENYKSTFFKMAPEWSLIPLVLLATMATVIASQALISGAFSLTAQAVNLGYLPRMNIVHTSAGERGQIYVPTVNFLLCVGCVGLVVGFGSASGLAGAYGLAVTGTMLVTTLLFCFVARFQFGWSTWKVVALGLLFAVFDVTYFAANLLKIPEGGWFPLAGCVALMVVFTTWKTGKRLVHERINGSDVSVEKFAHMLGKLKPMRTPGLGLYLGSNPKRTPTALTAHMHAAMALPEHICVVNVVTDPVPYVPGEQSLARQDFENGVSQVTVHMGYMDEVHLPSRLEQHGQELCGIDFQHGQYVLGRETLLVTDRPGMAMWRERLFRTMSRNSLTPDVWFDLPPDRTVEIGTRIEL